MNHFFKKSKQQFILGSLLSFTMILAYAGKPLFLLTPVTATTMSVPSNSTAQVQYNITNNTSKTRTLTIQSINAVTQTISGAGVCTHPFTLTPNQSCILTLTIDGATLAAAAPPVITSGPVVCKTKGNGDNNPDSFFCSQPATENTLNVSVGSPLTTAEITVTGSPLTLYANGPDGTLTITNTSTAVTATNISANFIGTALNGLVTQSASTCTSVAPSSSCTLTFTPGATAVSQTDFSIQGDNTNTATAAMAITIATPTLSSINPTSGTASGNAQVTLTGTNLTGATSITLDGTPATSVNVINSTSVTAVTPSHAAGVVDVIINTPEGSASLSNSYTYVTTAVGQSSGGGTIGCLNGAPNLNLIAATADNATSIQWGGSGTTTGATSNSDGTTNTTTIVTTLGAGTYAAQLCQDYEVDSAGNAPCQAGNVCYTDWFFPAKDQLNCFFTNKTAIGGFVNFVYWSSTESGSSTAWLQNYGSGGQTTSSKGGTRRVRCARAFTP